MKVRAWRRFARTLVKKVAYAVSTKRGNPAGRHPRQVQAALGTPATKSQAVRKRRYTWTRFVRVLAVVGTVLAALANILVAIAKLVDLIRH